MDKTICLMQCHTNNELKYQVIEHNMDYISEICDHVVINNSSEFNLGYLENKLKRFEDKVTIEYNYYENDHTICAGKLFEYLRKNIDFVSQSFNKCIVTNDSFVLVNSLQPFKKFITENNHDLYGILSSRERAFHYPDFLRAYSSDGIVILNDFIAKKLRMCRDKEDVINLIEIASTWEYENLGCLYEGDIKYKYNIHFDDKLLEQYLTKANYPIVKLRYLNKTSYYDVENFYLPEDFDPFEYKSINKDLHSMDEIDATKHLLKIGIYEGRKYKNNQPNNCPLYLQKLLKQKCPDINFNFETGE